MEIDSFAAELHRAGCIRFGRFQLKSGRSSPVYVDLRGLVSHPAALRSAGEALLSRLRGLEFDVVAGLPYAGLPLAVAVALLGDLPAVYPRKEAKGYGTARRVEGEFRPGQTAAVVDDVITDGGAKLELIEPLRQEGLRVRDVVVLVDREQGGRQALEAHGLALHSVLTLRQAIESLRRQGSIPEEAAREVLEYLDAG